MATALELCTRLGYPESLNTESQSLAKVLLNDLKAFTASTSMESDPNTLVTSYLTSPCRVFKSPYSWTSTGHKVTDVLSQLFSLIVQSQAMRDPVINLEDNDFRVGESTTLLALDVKSDGLFTQKLEDTAFKESVDLQTQRPDDTMREMITVPAVDIVPFTTLESEDAVLNIEPEYTVQDPATRGASQDAGPITRLAKRDPVFIADFLAAGFTEPFPLTASSEAEMLQVLDDWKFDHPGEDIPGSRFAGGSAYSRGYVNAASITVVNTLLEVSIRSLQVTISLMVDILQDIDGSCVVVIPAVGDTGSHTAYHAWLGGDLGFTSKTFADNAFIGQSILNSESASSHFGASCETGAAGGSDALPMEVYSLRNPVNNSDALDQTSPTTEVRIKMEPSLAEVRRATLRRNRTERRTDEERWRFETPPLSSMDTLKKRHWPRQYVSPPPTPQSKRTTKRRNVGGSLPKASLSGTSSPELLSVSPVTTPQESRRSARVNFKLPTPPKKPKKTKAKAKKPPKAPKLSLTAPRPAAHEAPATQDVILHFFLSNDTLGAVPVASAECSTAVAFFGQALAAWNIMGGGDHAEDMAAISVTIDGFHWPIVLPWGNATAFERMMETMAVAKEAKMGNLEIKVKCIRR